jgi:hypothetical protein
VLFAVLFGATLRHVEISFLRKINLPKNQKGPKDQKRYGGNRF